MKLTAILLLAAVFQVSASGTAQTVTYTGKDEPLTRVFGIIEKQTGLSVFYRDQDLQNTSTVTVSFNKVDLITALQVLLKDQPLEFQVEKKTIFIKKKADKKAADLTPQLMLDAPPITGVVTNADGQPLAGASVKIKGSNAGVVTDAEGRFSIDAAEGQVLVVTYVGFAAQEIAAKEGGVYVKLNASNNPLDEVVFKGYYRESKRLSTGTVAKVPAAVIEKQPVSNPLAALQGRVPGLSVDQYSGVPGSNFTVRVRGQNSLANGNDPLYIVDGVPFVSSTLSATLYVTSPYGSGASPLNSINLRDIESIEVLKDADATAIYGSRGANGVILITTKKGKAGKVRTDINAYAGSSKQTRKIKLLNLEQYMTMKNEAAANDGTALPFGEYELNGSWDTTRYTDWQKELLGNSAQFNGVNISLSGGSVNTQFLFSADYLKQGSLFEKDNFLKRGSYNFTLSQTSNDKKFKALFSNKYIVTNSDLVGFDFTGTYLQLSPAAPALYNEDGSLNWQESTWNNPLAFRLQKYKSRNYNLLSNAVLSYDLLPGLQLKLNGGINDLRTDDRSVVPSTIYDPAYMVTPAESFVRTNNASVKTWIIEPQVNYETAIRNGRLSVLMGTSFQSQESESSQQQFRGFATNSLINDPASATERILEGYSKTTYRYNAVYGRINYNFDGKYIINATARRDGSSRFGPGKQFATFGALGAAWIFSSEHFIKEALPVLSFGKLKVSYGTTGNDQIADYEYLDAYTSNYITYQGVSGLVPFQLFNPDYRWEENKKSEIGLELGFLQDRLLVNAAYYKNRSSNQLVVFPLAGTTGFAGVRNNLPAKVENTGLELEVNTTNVKKKNFTWSTNVNISLPKNKLIEFPGLEGSSYATQYVVGMPLSIAKRYHLLGVDSQTGIYQFEDMNKDGAITAADRLAVVNTGVKYFGGFNNSFVYRRFQLDILFQFVNKIAAGYAASFSSTPGRLINQPEEVLSRWRKPGDVSTVQKFTLSNSTVLSAYNRFTGSDGIYEDASFIRLKNVAFSYELPEKLTRMLKVRAYVQGQNLFTFTSYKGLDPETASSSRLAPLATFIAGLQVTL